MVQTIISKPRDVGKDEDLPNWKAVHLKFTHDLGQGKLLACLKLIRARQAIHVYLSIRVKQ